MSATDTFQALRGALQPITAHDKAMLPHLIAAHQAGTLDAKYLPRYREILANHVGGKGGFAKEAGAYDLYMAAQHVDPAAIAHTALGAYHHPMVQKAVNVLGNVGEVASNVDHPGLRLGYAKAKLQQYAEKVPTLGARQEPPKNPFGPGFKFAALTESLG